MENPVWSLDTWAGFDPSKENVADFGAAGPCTLEYIAEQAVCKRHRNMAARINNRSSLHFLEQRKEQYSMAFLGVRTSTLQSYTVVLSPSGEKEW